MKCPYCNEEMEMGYIKSVRSIYWGKDKELDSLFVPGNIKLNKFNLKDLFMGSFVEAYHCDDCKKIVVSYE